jgi:hypothetical protein
VTSKLQGFYHHVGFKKGRDLGEAGLMLEGEVVAL